jgi:nucleosome binding factor SPN SPT16 subunit
VLFLGSLWDASTYLDSALQSQEGNYVFLLALQQSVLKMMKAGTQVKDLYEFTVNEVKSKKPELADKLVKSIGFGVRANDLLVHITRSNPVPLYLQTGIDFRDSAYVINGKNAKTLRENMVFNLSLGFANIPDPKNKNKT